MTKRSLLPQTEGFTLIELMVVVAIIGLLGAIAIPNYQKFQAKTRQVEAKITLGAMYAVEVAFKIDQGTYSKCFAEIGYSAPDNQTRYYVAGWGAGVVHYNGVSYADGVHPPGCSIATGCPSVTCSATIPTDGIHYFSANASAKVGGVPAKFADICPGTSPGTVQSCFMDENNFTLGAGGQISTSSKNMDTWTIDQDKKLNNVKPVL